MNSCATLLKKLMILLIHSSRSLVNVCANELILWDNSGRNIQLDQAEYFDMDPLNGDSVFNMDACREKKPIAFSEWLAEAFVKRYPTGKELEMSDIPWISVDEGLLGLKKISIVEWMSQDFSYCEEIP